MVDGQVPAGRWEAADWIARRHAWVRELTARIVPGGTTTDNWLEQLTAAVVGVETHRQQWREYESAHPEPTTDSRWDAWMEAGPRAPADVAAFGVMSSGEQNVVRLVATLGGRVPWSPADVSFDDRGAAVLSDWLAVVRAQLPKWLYEDGPVANPGRVPTR